jgi:hypothetical protein
MMLCRAKRRKSKGESIVLSPAENVVSAETGVERRFYPRVEPLELINVSFGEESSAMVVNVSENGLLVSTPAALERNFVSRMSLPLSGLARQIEVYTRVVWTADSNRAGIQMLDLCDHDREQIRRWAAVQEARKKAAEQTGSTEQGSAVMQPDSINGKEPQKKKMPARVPVALGAFAAVAFLAMGLALWSSPLREWLVHSVKAGTKDVAAVQPVRGLLNTSVETQKQGVAPSGGAPKVSENAGTCAGAGDKGPDAENSPTPMKKMTAAPAASNGIGEKKPAVGKSANSDLRRRAVMSPTTHGDVEASSASGSGVERAVPIGKVPAASSVESAASQSNSNAAAGGSNAAKKPPEEPVDENPVAPNANANPARSNDAAPKAPAESSAIAVDPKPVDPGSPAKALSPNRAPVAAASSAVIEMAVPKAKALELTLPNSDRPSFLSVPGERVVQSQAVTLRIQRSVLAPPGHNWWGSERKKKVQLGELRARVDPRVPRTAQQPGGRVSVRAILGKDGRVERLMPVSGSAELVPSVVRAVREWQFEPTLMDGKPIETQAYVSVEFHAKTDEVARP